VEDLLFAAYLIGVTGLPGAIIGWLIARRWPEHPGRGMPYIGTTFGIGLICGVLACIAYSAVAAVESPYLFAVAVFAGVTNFLAATSTAGAVLAREEE
jgi:hypothetical protein